MQLFYLMFWLAIAGYVFGKRTGKEWLWVLASIPVSIAAYFSIFFLLSATH